MKTQQWTRHTFVPRRTPGAVKTPDPPLSSSDGIFPTALSFFILFHNCMLRDGREKRERRESSSSFSSFRPSCPHCVRKGCREKRLRGPRGTLPWDKGPWLWASLFLGLPVQKDKPCPLLWAPRALPIPPAAPAQLGPSAPSGSKAFLQEPLQAKRSQHSSCPSLSRPGATPLLGSRRPLLEGGISLCPGSASKVCLPSQP